MAAADRLLPAPADVWVLCVHCVQAAPDVTGLGCHVAVHVAVPFSKRCMVKGLITGATFKDCQVGGWVGE